jgi:transcriptional regulator with XRE-family HTH domain
MRTHEKLRVIRAFKGWSQDEMAEKLGYSVNGYAKVERGETQIKADKLAQIAEVIGIDFQQLLDLNEKNVFNILENYPQPFQHSSNIVGNCSSQHNNIYLTETQCAHELEKAHLIIEQKDKEIALMKQQIEDLRAMLDLMKNK